MMLTAFRSNRPSDAVWPWFDTACCLAFWACAALVLVHLFWHGQQVFSIILWDETSYLDQGLMLSARSFASPETSPGYSVFYFFLSKLVSDPVDVYVLGGIAITCATFLAVRFATLAASRSRLLAVAAGSFLISTGYLFVWPRVTLAASALICILFAAALKLRGAYAKL